jgi:hypothetical protein
MITEWRQLVRCRYVHSAQLVGVELRGHHVAKDQMDWGRARVAEDAERDVV